MKQPRLRSSEWILLAFFAYIALLSCFFRDRPELGYQPVITLFFVSVLLFLLVKAENGRFKNTVSLIRDWMPLALTLLAFRGMEAFIPLRYDSANEAAWIRWDDLLFSHGFGSAVEHLGPVFSSYLELCYLLVYTTGSFCIAVLWIAKRRREENRFNVILLTGTLLSYALFPYFPSRPPRFAFPNSFPPAEHNLLRSLNVYLLNHASIHTGVFPSAHVSSAFAAAWGMFLVLPRSQKRFAWWLLLFAVSVARATVYGRYHYAADAVAGFFISLTAAALCFVLRRCPNSPVTE